MRDRKNPYETLGIRQNADQKEIRAAYRNLAKKYHPDTGDGSSAERFRAVQDAYDLLSDIGKRKEYDRSSAEPAYGRSVRFASYYYPPQYSSRGSHIDLRDLGKREPLEHEYDPFDELLGLFFREF
jgi:curved DNA-binding protein CbpA